MAQDYVKGMLSSGEVVLIDTRQHWMAAVRYALKPILLFVLVGLLVLVNQMIQFDGVLGIVNDVIHIGLIIAIIAALVWLPIDFVRWWSRKYVLTNRRAMRMDGVLRKKSFDSSLEQINDIGFVQSVIGRAMGYADLTLYTASDTANETYEQLMDGLQFKKAVLDAKEALRADAPLTELREGFIVKGGTNLASMRADGRLEEAAAEHEAAPAAETPAAEAQAPTAAEAAADEAPAESTPEAWPKADAASPGDDSPAAETSSTDDSRPA
ncbi:MAG: PH domain-containing protein [Chloroflexota bacterium]